MRAFAQQLGGTLAFCSNQLVESIAFLRASSLTNVFLDGNLFSRPRITSIAALATTEIQKFPVMINDGGDLAHSDELFAAFDLRQAHGKEPRNAGSFYAYA